MAVVEKADLTALMRVIALAMTNDKAKAEKVLEWAYNDLEKPKRTRTAQKVVSKAGAVERIYAIYPPSTIRPDGNRVSLKSKTDKDKILRLLELHSEDELTGIITRYLAENNGPYLKMLSTLLNNLPDYGSEAKPAAADEADAGDLFSDPAMAQYLADRRKLYEDK